MMAQRSFISDYLCTEKENPHILEGKFTKSEKIAVPSPWSHCSSELYRNGNISDAHFAADSTPPGEDADPDFSMLKQAKEDYVKLQWRLCSVPGCKSCFEHVSSLRAAEIARACSLQVSLDFAVARSIVRAFSSRYARLVEVRWNSAACGP
jgi:hypothetical protein